MRALGNFARFAPHALLSHSPAPSAPPSPRSPTPSSSSPTLLIRIARALVESLLSPEVKSTPSNNNNNPPPPKSNAGEGGAGSSAVKVRYVYEFRQHVRINPSVDGMLAMQLRTCCGTLMCTSKSLLNGCLLYPYISERSSCF